LKTDYATVDGLVFRHFQGDGENDWRLETLYLDDERRIIGRKPSDSESRKAIMALMSGRMLFISLSTAVKILENPGYAPLEGERL